MLTAIDPRHAFFFFREHGWHGFAVLGAVFLVVTGGEALYADMGHFGRRPIRIAWFGLVLPALLLNYFGQGALLLSNPQAAEQPFFLLAPDWALFPLVGLATAAAIIASQALISGAFSLTRQAIQLGYCPRLDIEHTSSHEIGQVYVPQVNWALMVSTIAIVIGFGSSTALAAAYGIAVTLTMVITAVLLHVVAIERWRWPAAVAFAVTGVFLTVDLAFFGANALKIAHGGWLPLVIGTLLFTLMTTWKRGRQIVAQRLTARAVPLEDFMARVEASRAGPGARHGGVHDGAATRHAARARPQPALQQGPARARRHADGHHPAGAARAGRRADHRPTARPRRFRRRRPLRFHGGSERPGGARARARMRPRVGQGGRDVLSGTGDADCDSRAWHGDVARTAVRVDGAKCRAGDGVFQASARASRRARRSGRAVDHGK